MNPKLSQFLTPKLASKGITYEEFLTYLATQNTDLLNYIEEFASSTKRKNKRENEIIAYINEIVVEETDEEVEEPSPLNPEEELTTNEDETEDELEEPTEETIHDKIKNIHISIVATITEEKKSLCEGEVEEIEKLKEEVELVQDKLNEMKASLRSKENSYFNKIFVEESEVRNYIYKEIATGNKTELISVLQYLDTRGSILPAKKSYNTKKTNSTNNKETNYTPDGEPSNFFFRFNGEDTSADKFFKNRWRCAFNCRIERNSREGMKRHILGLCERNPYCVKVLKKYENNFNMDEAEAEKYLDGEEERLKKSKTEFKADFKNEKKTLSFN